MDYFDCARMFTVYMTLAYGWIISEVKSRLTSYYKLCLVFRSIWLNCVKAEAAAKQGAPVNLRMTTKCRLTHYSISGCHCFASGLFGHGVGPKKDPQNILKWSLEMVWHHVPSFICVHPVFFVKRTQWTVVLLFCWPKPAQRSWQGRMKVLVNRNLSSCRRRQEKGK